MSSFTRRSFVNSATSIAAAIALDVTASALPPRSSQPSTFLDILHTPDKALVYIESQQDSIPLSRAGSTWQSSGIQLRSEATANSVSLFVTAPTAPITRIHLRWNAPVNPSLLCLGDAWERSYGDLAWRSLVPERVLPWYFATHDLAETHTYGVHTGAAAFCFWQLDPAGISLWLDLSNGGSGVLLGQRELLAATIVTRQGHTREHPIDAIAAFCKSICPNPRLPQQPIFGTNDWYYAYGNNTAQGILRDTDLVVSLSPAAGPRPFSVIDDGWQANGTIAQGERGNTRFPNMAHLCEQIRARGARPGIWIRPLQAPRGTNPDLLLPLARFRSPAATDHELAYDPTIPEALPAILEKVTQVVTWNYDLIKHDYSTYDLLGQWGFQMGAQPTIPGWHFHDRSLTNAEIILNLYKSIRATAGDQTMLLGCNTVGHLAAGLFEINRTGDDTSGQHWERTRRMGVNTLAYRLPQHRSFFDLDADCVGLTNSIPWNLNRQWMDLIARSGTALFLSPSPEAIGPEQIAAIRDAFAIAASGASTARPQDLLNTTAPERWSSQGQAATPGDRSQTRLYNWCGDTGCDPFSI